MRSLAIAACCGALSVSACASHAPNTTAGLDQQVQLTPRDNGTLVYRSPTLDISKYHSILVEDADVYKGADADFGKVDPAERVRLAAQLSSDFRDELRKRHYTLASAAGPGVVRLRLTLAGITTSRPVASTLLRLTPVGVGMTALNSVGDRPAAFTGSVTVSGQLQDTQSNELLVAFVARESPMAYDLTSGLSPLRASELAITRGARDFCDAMDRSLGR
jgi:Protein of unknown function (DUF3313)